MDKEQENGGSMMSGITQSLIAEVAENTKISIKNIYFRFEDMIKDKRTGREEVFAIGLKLKEFSVFTSDSKYCSLDDNCDKNIHKKDKDNKPQENTEGLAFKVVRLLGFSIFCDWKDIKSVQVASNNEKSLSTSKIELAKKN